MTCSLVLTEPCPHCGALSCARFETHQPELVTCCYSKKVIPDEWLRRQAFSSAPVPDAALRVLTYGIAFIVGIAFVVGALAGLLGL